MKVNLKLLKRLYLIDHESTNEHDMISFILNYCYKIPHLTFSIDKERNLFITKNTTNPESYACVVAHMDTVHTFASARELIIRDGIISAQYIKSGLPCGLNADDCNGILVALQLLETLPNLKVCFTTQEEIGGKGAYEAANNIEFFLDVRYLIQADRRGTSDLIIHTNGIDSASENFVKDIKPLMEKYKYFEETGTFTDIGVLASELLISGVNVSCGYYNEHTFKECCNINELNNCLNFIYEIITSLDDQTITYTIKAQESYVSNYYSSYDYDNYIYDDSPKDIYDLPCNHCIEEDCMHCKETW